MISHNDFILTRLPIPHKIDFVKSDVDMGEEDVLNLADNSNGFGGCTGVISLENDEYLQISQPKIREIHFDPIQLSSNNELSQKLTSIPSNSPIIIFAPFHYEKDKHGNWQKELHPNLTKMIENFIKYRTKNYKIISYNLSEKHSFGATYNQETKVAKVYTSTQTEPVYSYKFEF